MKGLPINCPHCKEKSELYLVSTPYMMVLNCPDCQCTLLHCEGRTYEIDDMKVVQMEREQIQKFVENLKQKSLSGESISDYSKSSGGFLIEDTSPKNNLHQAGVPIRENTLTPDDILNLKIGLESCEDVLEFIQEI